MPVAKDDKTLDIDRIEALYREHGGALLVYLRRMFGGAVAEDLLHETFMRALRSPESLARAQSPRAWLFGVARHVGLDALRRRRCVELPADVASPEDAETDDRMDRVRQAVARLPCDQRETLELRLADELTYEEIAAALEIPVGTVRSRLHHAVRQLRELLTAGG